MASFEFDPVGTALETHGFLAHVRAGIGEPSELFEALAEALRLPDYFGHNWDALEECLRDLSWISEPVVTLAHADLPKLDDAQLRVYLDVLESAVEDWAEDIDHRFVVRFPVSERARLESLMARDRDEIG